MQVLAQAHWPPGFGHADFDALSFEDLNENHCGREDVSICRCSAPIENQPVHFPKIVLRVIRVTMGIHLGIPRMDGLLLRQCSVGVTVIGLGMIALF